MDNLGRNHARVAHLNAYDTLFRAALLCGYGAQAKDLAARMASVCHEGDGRSCVEAGTPLLITVEAPGEAQLRVGLRLGETLHKAALEALTPEPRAAALANAFAALPASQHTGLGYWIFWSLGRQAVFVDLRDPEPDRALERARLVLVPSEQARLNRVLSSATAGRPWGLSIEFDRNNRRITHLYWFTSKPASAASLVDAFVPGGWRQVLEVLSHLLSLPGQSGRWLLAIPLESTEEENCLWVGNSAWGLVPEDDRKHRAIAQLMMRYGGPRDFAEALWSFCQGASESGWRVGRSCEAGVRAEGPRARLLLTPQLAGGATAEIKSSESLVSAIGPTEEEPFGA